MRLLKIIKYNYIMYMKNYICEPCNFTSINKTNYNNICSMIINQEKWNFLLFYFDYYIEKLEQDTLNYIIYHKIDYKYLFLNNKFNIIQYFINFTKNDKINNNKPLLLNEKLYIELIKKYSEKKNDDGITYKIEKNDIFINEILNKFIYSIEFLK